MEYDVKPKNLARQEKGFPVTIQQLIQKYKLDAIWENIENMVKEIIEQNSGYVVKKDGVMYIADTNVLEEATVVLRIGKNFLDISNNGFEGDYQTIIALDGTINADFIKAGTMQANRIKGGTLTLGGNGNGNGSIDVKDSSGNTNVLIDNNGIVLNDGTKLVGNGGVLSQFQYKGGAWLGYDYLYYEEFNRTRIILDIYIPENFIVTSAKVILQHTPIYWNYDIENKTAWGWSRNVRLYKSDSTGEIIDAAYNSEYYSAFVGKETEIANAFGSNGFTASSASNSNHKTEQKESIDIKNSISKGRNIFTLRTANALPTTVLSAMQQTGSVEAILNIMGFVK